MSTFALQLKAFEDKTKARADDLVGLVVTKIAQRLDERSPVGDASYWKSKPPAGYVGGRFRGNWQLGVSTIPQGETGRIDPSGGATVSAIIASVPDHAAGLVFFLANNVPYSQRIEDGWSRQAPTGLVALTAMEFRAIVGEVVSETRQ
jgi:hypothetical protein